MDAAHILHAMAQQNHDWTKEKVEFLKLALAHMRRESYQPYISIEKLEKVMLWLKLSLMILFFDAFWLSVYFLSFSSHLSPTYSQK